MNKNIAISFKWIINILNKYNFKFQISGGLSAITYGSKRKLYDIDIDLESKNIKRLSKLKEIKKHIIFGPKRIKASNFDVFLLTLNYNGVLIDLGESLKMLDSRSNSWINDRTNFDNFELKNIFGINVPVIPLDGLINYKKILSRNEDIEDLKYIDSLKK